MLCLDMTDNNRNDSYVLQVWCMKLQNYMLSNFNLNEITTRGLGEWLRKLKNDTDVYINIANDKPIFHLWL